MPENLRPPRRTIPAVAAMFLAVIAGPATAEIDGHGPDAWRVTGVAADDALNARMGPGTAYPVIDTFAHDERGLQQVTCVPFYTMAHVSAMTEAQIAALPPRWCLMRSADLSKAGWVAQRFLMEDHPEATSAPAFGPDAPMIAQARDLVQALFTAADRAAIGGPHPLDPGYADAFFSSEIVAHLRSRPLEADPLVGAQDFEGRVSAPVPDPEQPMFRGMISINVDITNFGRTHTAVFRLRADTTRPDAPLRIFRIDHAGWSFP